MKSRSNAPYGLETNDTGETEDGGQVHEGRFGELAEGERGTHSAGSEGYSPYLLLPGRDFNGRRLGLGRSLGKRHQRSGYHPGRTYGFDRCGVRGSSGRRGLRGRSRPHDLAVVRDDGSADDFVLQVDVVVVLLANRE